MANQKLVDYIETVGRQGFSEPMIRDVLSKNGWHEQNVNEAFSYIRMIKETMSSSAPVPEKVEKVDVSVMMPSTARSAQTAEISTINEYNSPYSIGLAIILFGALLVLINQIIDDSAFFTSSINGKLIFDAFLILPFLLVAFVLHGSFHTEERKHFLIISQPYFLVSAFLLVRLLWDTSAYILDKNATYGVYVVLALIIVVLTGVIIFIQKYIKN